jgi:anti-sigma factor RsiW
MACERYEDALSEAAAGAPPAAELESHLASCARCRENLEELRRTLALVDSDLRQLVAVEPSPALAARIRRAAAEPEAPQRPGFWLWPAVAAAGLLVVLAVTLGRRPSAERAVAQEARPPQPIGATSSPRVAEPAVIPSAPPPPVAARGRALAGHREAAAEPEVLVPPGETEALLRLVARMDRDKVAPPVLVSVDRPSPELAELRSIDITPLEIVPLDPAESSGT